MRYCARGIYHKCTIAPVERRGKWRIGTCAGIDHMPQIAGHSIWSEGEARPDSVKPEVHRSGSHAAATTGNGNRVRAHASHIEGLGSGSGIPVIGTAGAERGGKGYRSTVANHISR